MTNSINRANEILKKKGNQHCSCIHAFRIIYIVREAGVFGKSKPSQKYCLEIGKQIAALKFQKCVLNAELRIM